jgi:hypothetical protein
MCDWPALASEDKTEMNLILNTLPTCRNNGKNFCKAEDMQQQNIARL